MFFEGDLRSGITAALEQSKSVACFVTGNDEESTTWENEYLLDPEAEGLLSSRSVLLRLEAGSQGAQYLSAICPLPKTPTFVVIDNGQLKEYMTAGTSKNEFLKRIRAILRDRDSEDNPDSKSVDPAEGVNDDGNGSAGLEPVRQDQIVAEEGDETISEDRPSQVVQDLLRERRERMEATQKEKEDSAAAERAAKAKARKEELAHASSSNQKNSPEMTYAIMQKKRQQEAREERARVLKRVEDDKAERRAREFRRRQQTSAGDESQTTLDTKPSHSSRQTPTSKGSLCAIQVRLFDGRTIRSRFSSTSTLQRDIRAWIDKEVSPNDIPYTFKQILTPDPNRTISVAEEEHSLDSLGFLPSATLVLIPVRDYTSAYENSATSLVTKSISSGYSLVTAGVGLVGTWLTGLTGLTGNNSTQQVMIEESPNGPSSAQTPGLVRTFRTHDEHSDDHQLYNGNALNFEPRKEEDSEDR